MLKKQNRLNEKSDFEKVFKKGRSIYGEFIAVKVLKNILNESRVGVVVGIKVSKKAVERNRIKKALKNIIKQEIDKFDTEIDVVLLALPKIKEKSYNEIKEEVLKNLKKVNVY